MVSDRVFVDEDLGLSVPDRDRLLTKIGGLAVPSLLERDHSIHRDGVVDVLAELGGRRVHGREQCSRPPQAKHVGRRGDRNDDGRGQSLDDGTSPAKRTTSRQLRRRDVARQRGRFLPLGDATESRMEALFAR